MRIINLMLAISTSAGVIAFIVERFEKQNNRHAPYGIYEKYFKRPLDAFLSTAALIVLSPILAIIALLVRINLGSPVVFAQERPGRDEKIFKILKFRSMTDEHDEDGKLLPDEKRLTKFGRVLRASSLDELISLINIVKGELAIVGPRPLGIKYLPYYTKEERHRHDIRPGLTGLAQVKGRNALSWDEKFAYDIEYVNHISFIQDIHIIFETAVKVFRREGIGQGEERPESLHIERAGREESD